MNKTELNLIQNNLTYKKLYAMNEKIEGLQQHGYSTDEINKLIDEFFEHGIITNAIVKLDHPAEAAVRESMNQTDQSTTQKNEIISLDNYDFDNEMEEEDQSFQNHLIFDSTLKSTRTGRIGKSTVFTRPDLSFSDPFSSRNVSQMKSQNSYEISREFSNEKENTKRIKPPHSEYESKEDLKRLQNKLDHHQSIMKMKLSSSFCSNPHVLSVCKTFPFQIYSENDLADAVLDCLDY